MRGKNNRKNKSNSEKTPMKPATSQGIQVMGSSSDPMISLLTKLRSKNERTIDDVFNCLAAFIESQIARDKRELETKKQLNDIEVKVSEHEVLLDAANEGMKNLGNQMDKMKSNVSANETILHRNEQKNIDNDIFLTAFPYKPIAEQVAKKLLTIAEIPHEALKNAYVIPMRSRPNANSTQTNNAAPAGSYAVVISLYEKQQKMNFLSARRTLGPIKIAQLMEVNSNPDITIKCSNRLTHFNLSALKELNTAKSNKFISDMQFHNGLFRVKFQANGHWEVLGSSYHLAYIRNHDRIAVNMSLI